MAPRPLRRSAAAFALVLASAAGCGSPAPDFVPAAAPPPPATATASAPPLPPPTTPAAASPTPPPPSRPAKSPVPAARPAHYTFPVRASNASFGETHSGYPASDIFADCGTAVVAVTGGVVLEINLVDRYDPASPSAAERGGLSVSLLGDDGVRYYGSHLSAVTSGIRAGVRVREGQRLGNVGKTGRASGVCHLHFGISPPCGRTGDWWIRRGVVWPARYLGAWRNGKALSPAAAVTAYRRTNGCPAAP